MRMKLKVLLWQWKSLGPNPFQSVIQQLRSFLKEKMTRVDTVIVVTDDDGNIKKVTKLTNTRIG